MTSTLLSGFMLFCLVSSITPGPNNLMLMAAGANFGARRALPHAAGIVLGFTFMIIIIGLGAAQLFQTYPLAHTVLTVASVTYLLYLAYKIATAAPKMDETGRSWNSHHIPAGCCLSMGQPKGLDYGARRHHGLHAPANHQLLRDCGFLNIWRNQSTFHQHLVAFWSADETVFDHPCAPSWVQLEHGGPVGPVTLSDSNPLLRCK